jgi:L-ascorbate metabolism protein UlaG (beta-lactamase superfamily)
MHHSAALEYPSMRSNVPGQAADVDDRGELAITWVGHATVLVEIDGMRLLTDPVLRDRVGPLVRIAPAVHADDLGVVDCVLLSHLHADHADLPSLRALSLCGPVIVPRGAGRWLNANGLRNVRELAPGQSVQIEALHVVATVAEHDPRRRPFGPAADPVGYLIRGSRCIYFAGDTDLFPAMADLRGQVDVALLPVWGWGSRLGPGHLDPDRAARAAGLIAPALSVPIHWGTLALSRPARRPADPQRPAREFAALTKRYAPGVDVRVLAPGARITLPDRLNPGSSRAR